MAETSVTYNTLSNVSSGMDGGPFSLDNTSIYNEWRRKKLSLYPVSLENLLVKIDNICRITPKEESLILERCQKYNMAVYQVGEGQCDINQLKSFCRVFGLENLDHHYCNDGDGITALRVSQDNNKGGFIPYSDKAISFHTDGYYNAPEEQIHGVLLHCHTPAIEGGENLVMDQEMAYLRTRDESPAFIEALMKPDAMTIPAHVENGRVLRAEQTGPVFSIYDNGQRLHMRFSQRKRYIKWREDDISRQAVAFLNQLLQDNQQDMLQIKLSKGQGVICNNVLHTRTAFKDTKEQSRLIYRGRFFEPVTKKI